jgi:hypothetical protein
LRKIHNLSFLSEFLSPHLKRCEQKREKSFSNSVPDVTTRIAAESCCFCTFSLFLRDKKWFRTRLEF